MMRWSLLMRRRLCAVVSRLVGDSGEGEDGGDVEAEGDAGEIGEVAVTGSGAAAGEGVASASTQWAKPVRSPSGNRLRYSSHFDNKGIMEDADKPIAPILL